MPKYAGTKGTLYLGATAGGAASLVANLTKWTLNLIAEKVDVTCLGDTWKKGLQTIKSATLKASGFWADDADIPFDAFDLGSTVYAYVYPASPAAGKYWYGSVWADGVTVDVDVKGVGSISVDTEFDDTVTRIG